MNRRRRGRGGVAQFTGQVAQEGTKPFLVLIVILAAKLALMNLLPIPVLNGGAPFLCTARLALRRPLPSRAQAFCTRAGVAVLAALFMMTTLHDLAHTGLFRWLTNLLGHGRHMAARRALSSARTLRA